MLMILSILGCEKEMCLECTTTITGPDGSTIVKVDIDCGTYTNRELQYYERTVWIPTGEATAITYCKEVK